MGDVVHKVGRTTGVRHGRVTAFELDGVAVEYDIGVLTFDDQIEIEGSGTRSFSDAGDSGSLIVDDQMKGGRAPVRRRRPRRVQRQGPDVREPDRRRAQGAQGEARVGNGAMPITLEQARAAKESAKVLLAALPGVVGVGITKVGEDYALKVNLREPLPAGVSAPERSRRRPGEASRWSGGSRSAARTPVRPERPLSYRRRGPQKLSS